MKTVFLLLTALVTTAGFNILKDAVVVINEGEPLFGQETIQSKNGILVTSPTSGKLFRCELNGNCTVVTEDTAKGLRPIQSASSMLTGQTEEEQHLVCQQIKTKVRVKEELNGRCLYQVSSSQKEIIDPAEEANNIAIANNTNKNNNNNNNNNNNDDDDEDEDPGTEIAFVLDGSGSIDPPDFVKAKDFITQVMKNVWSQCFDCNFAVVQYGRFVRTELSLKENDDASKAIEKIPNIEQIGNHTITASAINHVLEHVFVPENGSKPNSQKYIIVVTDGIIFLDKMNLTVVLKNPKMENITRFAIGVGPDVLNHSAALKEMREIASDPHEQHFFGVGSYTGLNTILSKLKKGILGGIEGTAGVGFRFELAEAGFSSHIAPDNSLLFGAVGAFDWSGGLIVKNIETSSTAFLNVTNNEPKIPKTAGKEQRFSYLGYSVTSAQRSGKTLYLSGAPRYNLTGGVFIFSGETHDLQQLLPGDQVGSYFGSVLCVLNVDKSEISKTDYLLVGAPYFHRKGEEGKVFVYKLHEQHGFQKQDWEWSGVTKYAFARFGSAIANIGDVDGNGYNDVAVGAPLEERNGGTSGSIYIYNGFRGGLRQEHSQRISAAEMGMKLKYFGQSVSPMAEAGPRRQEYISVGSEGNVTVLKTLPVIVFKPTITVEPPMIKRSHQAEDIPKLEIKLHICLYARSADFEEVSSISVLYNIDLDPGQAEKRLTFHKASKQGNFSLTKNIACISKMNLHFSGCSDCFSPILVKFNFNLTSTTAPYVLDAFTPTEISKEITFERQCEQELCPAKISLSNSRLSKQKIIIGDTQDLDITLHLTNTGYDSFKTTLTLTYPSVLLFSKILKKPERTSCENAISETFSELKCNLSHPNYRSSSQAILSMSWQIENIKSAQKTADISVILANENNGSQILDQRNFTFEIENALRVGLQGKSEPTSLKNEEETVTKPLKIIFQPEGENKHDAPLNITITIKLETTHTKVSIKRSSPESGCVFPYEGEIEGEYQMHCVQTNLTKIIISMDVHIFKTQEHDEKIVVKGELGFDQSTFVALDRNRLKKEVVVTVRKLAVVKSIATIIGGSIGGFLFLAIIIVILWKCGFFKRRHQVEQR